MPAQTEAADRVAVIVVDNKGFDIAAPGISGLPQPSCKAAVTLKLDMPQAAGAEHVTSMLRVNVPPPPQSTPVAAVTVKPLALKALVAIVLQRIGSENI